MVLWLHPVWSQVNRYMVFLNDKENSPYTLDRPEDFLSARALERQQSHDYQIKPEDLPVNPTYVEQVAGTGAEVYYRSRWLNAILIQANGNQILTVENLDIVDTVEFVGPGAKLGARLGSNDPSSYPGLELQKLSSTLQNQMIDIPEMHAQGYRGEEMLIAVFDGGFQGVDQVEPFNHLFENDQIKGVFNYVNNDQEVYQFTPHGTQVLSVLAAFDTVEIIGTAYKSDYYLLVTEDDASEYRIEEYNWAFAAEFADSAGVDVINSSLGYFDFDSASMNYSYEEFDGKTTVIAKAANRAAERGILIVASAGNEGNKPWMFITTPADSENVLAIGAVNTLNELADFSSSGPTADLRIKPDLVALGVGTSAVLASGTISLKSGTSFAAPLVAGLAAGFWQAHPELTNTEVIERLRRSGDNYDTPDNQRGFGLPSFTEAQEVVGLGEEIVVSDYKIYPNPASTQISISIGKDRQPQKVIARLYTVAGRMLLDVESIGQNAVQLDLSNFSAGVYILSIISPAEKRTVRVIKY